MNLGDKVKVNMKDVWIDGKIITKNNDWYDVKLDKPIELTKDYFLEIVHRHKTELRANDSRK